MAYVATYISTTSTTELSDFYEEITDENTTIVEDVIKLSYDYVNEHYDATLPVPIPKQANGRHPAAVKRAQAAVAVAMLRERKFGATNEEVVKLWEAADTLIGKLTGLKVHIDRMYSSDEIGIGYPIAAAANTGTGELQVDVTRDFSGAEEQTYTITVTECDTALVGPHSYSWSDGQGNTTTLVLAAYTWTHLENNVWVRFVGAWSLFKFADSWTIRCVPLDTHETAGGPISTIPVRI